MTAVPKITPDALIRSYDGLLIDAFGVLVDGRGPITGAAEFIDRLLRAKKPFYVLTNDASRLPGTAATLYHRAGLPIRGDQVITSGELLVPHFEHHGLQGANCVVLGPEDSKRYVEAAGGVVIGADESRHMEVLVACDESGFPLLDTLDAVLTGLLARLDAGGAVHLVLPNPDLIYPKGSATFGVAVGSLAGLIEAVLRQRYPARPDLTFARLGKPYPAIFDEAVRRAGTRRLAIIGDQLPTDIRGAIDYGLDSVLVGTGVTPLERHWSEAEIRPTYVMPSLS